MASYTSIKDMFDGSGPGQSGAQFEGGGVLSAIGNAVARPAGSRDRGEPDMRTGVLGFARDAVNGGGWGASGETFQGGPYGGMIGMGLNALGVRPMGYAERGQQLMQDAMARVAAQAAQSRPTATSYAPMTSPRPPMRGAPVAPVTTSSLGDIDALRAEMMRMGLLPAPMSSNIGYGPR